MTPASHPPPGENEDAEGSDTKVSNEESETAHVDEIFRPK